MPSKQSPAFPRLALLATLPAIALIGGWVAASLLPREVPELRMEAQERASFTQPLNAMNSALQQLTVLLWQQPTAERERYLNAIDNQVKRFDLARQQYAKLIAGTEAKGSEKAVDEKWQRVTQLLSQALPAELKPSEAEVRRSAVERLPAAVEALANSLFESARLFEERNADGEVPIARGRIEPKPALIAGILAVMLLLTSSLLLRGLASGTQVAQELEREMSNGMVLLHTTQQQVSNWGNDLAREIEYTHRLLGELAGAAKQAASHAQDALLESHAQNGYGVGGGVRSRDEQEATVWAEVAQRSRKIQQSLERAEEIFFQIDLLAVNLAVEAAKDDKIAAGYLAASDAVRDLSRQGGDSLRELRGQARENAESAEHMAASNDESGATLDVLTESLARTTHLTNDIAGRITDHLARISEVTRGAQSWPLHQRAAQGALERLHTTWHRMHGGNGAEAGNVVPLTRETTAERNEEADRRSESA